MTQFEVCAACKIAKHGIKTRVSVSHTCARGDKRYKEPETKVMGKTSGFHLPAGTYYQIKIHQLMFETGKASKYSLRRAQYVNGYKIKPGVEAWFPFNLHHMDTNLPLEKCIWVHESHYKTLAFV